MIIPTCFDLNDLLPFHLLRVLRPSVDFVGVNHEERRSPEQHDAEACQSDGTLGFVECKPILTKSERIA
jgi:hypothetical protein